MKKRLIGTIILILFCSSLLPAQPLVIGRVSNNVEKTVSRLQPVVEYVAAAVSGSAFTSGSVVVAKDIFGLVSAVQSGNIHWVTESPYAAAILVNEIGMIPILIRHKKCQKTYASVLITRLNIEKWDQLIGSTIAVEDPNSFSGYFLVYKAVVESGMPVHYLKNPRDPGLPNKVNFVFSKDEDNSLKWLELGIVDGAVFNSVDYENRLFFPDNIREKTRKLYNSAQYPRAIELISGRLPVQIRDTIKLTLTDLGARTDHPVLIAYDNSSGFSEFHPAYQRQLENIYQFIRAR